MKQMIPNYTFVAAAKTIELDDFAAVRLDRLLLIVNVTRNVIYYNIADATLGATVATNVITLVGASTAGHANGDKLEVFYDTLAADPDYATGIVVTGPLTDAQLRATPVPVSGTVAVTGVATAANQATEIAGLVSIDGHVDNVETLLAGGLPSALVGGRLSVDVGVSALPAGAATSAKQDSQTTLLAGGLPAALATGGGLKADLTTIIGVAPTVNAGGVGAGSLRVVLATDQPALTNSLLVTAAGNVASDIPVTANPLLDGGRASTAVPAAVSADGDAAALWVTRNGALVVDGGVASGATDSGNPQKIGAVTRTTKPTYTDGQRGDLQMGTRGSLAVSLFSADSTGTPNMGGTSTDGNSTGTVSISVQNNNQLFNGTNWDRQRGTILASLLGSGARTTTQTSADVTNYNHRGVSVILDVTSAGTGSITLSIQGKDNLGVYYTILTGAAVVTNSTNVYRIYPGITVTANATADVPLPRTFRVVVTANNANSMTYSLTYDLHL